VSLITLYKAALYWSVLCKECHVYMYVQKRDKNKEIDLDSLN